jgi:hypothetical protein
VISIRRGFFVSGLFADDLRAAGYVVGSDGQGERILPHSITERFSRAGDGRLVMDRGRAGGVGRDACRNLQGREMVFRFAALDSPSAVNRLRGERHCHREQKRNDELFVGAHFIVILIF